MLKKEISNTQIRTLDLHLDNVKSFFLNALENRQDRNEFTQIINQMLSYIHNYQEQITFILNKSTNLIPNDLKSSIINLLNDITISFEGGIISDIGFINPYDTPEFSDNVVSVTVINFIDSKLVELKVIRIVLKRSYNED
ncbi:MAG: hypothetical protein A2X19_06105 [Bacteroidetes bacterium GWE2_39_28]|nr:MAG: hypothetical protein A2X19_06105 [Bacteroidetes bacterium GWE2_39_28]OFY12816.1 MAG: hypothetical protein A2X16_00885 [Bacteroidetes bacterium GWF2_39_10]OFZ11038.1 MAG: hypothetical protein A2465_00920 [Bacteroidetes bacterium RIFOXYC2_FULL_39_11]HCT93705.1 hypothetical protein [Rikenellaceae bacterium]